ncbi:MAG: hypothetical protein ACRDS9_13270 [Pseudonocardiaceae bacterium]
MTLRLHRRRDQALRAQTEAEHRSMQEVLTAVTALREAGTDVVGVVTAVIPIFVEDQPERLESRAVDLGSAIDGVGPQWLQTTRPRDESTVGQ